MPRIALCMFLALYIALSSAQAAEDWAQFRGPNGTGVATAKNMPVEWSGEKDSETKTVEKNIAWKTELPGPGASSPILIGDRIYLTTYTPKSGSPDKLKRHLIAMSRDDGNSVWQKDVDAKLPEQEKIREEHGYASSTPVADAKGVICFFGKSGVFAFDHQGNQLWQADVGSNLNGWGSATSPILYKNLVIVNASVESESMVALDRATGKEIWRAKNIKESWNTPILVPSAAGKDSKQQLIVAVFRKILGFDPDSGEQLWSCDTAIDWYMAPSLVAADELIFSVGGRTGGSLAVRAGGMGDVTSSHRVWTGRKGSNVTSPVYYEGHVYWMHENQGIAYCAEAKTGKIVYEERVRGANQVYASPVIADGKLYYFNRESRGFVLPAAPEYKLLATNELERRGVFNSSPAVADDSLYLRTNKAIYRIAQP